MPQFEFGSGAASASRNARFSGDISMDHLREIEDIAVRHAIDIFQGCMEIAIGNLLDDDRNTALSQLNRARDRALNLVNNLGSEVISIDQEAKTLRIAVGLLETTFDRLRNIRSSDHDDAAGG